MISPWTSNLHGDQTATWLGRRWWWDLGFQLWSNSLKAADQMRWEIRSMLIIYLFFWHSWGCAPWHAVCLVQSVKANCCCIGARCLREMLLLSSFSPTSTQSLLFTCIICLPVTFSWNWKSSFNKTEGHQHILQRQARDKCTGWSKNTTCAQEDDLEQEVGQF